METSPSFHRRTGQFIPVYINNSFFKTLDKLINSFIWGYKLAQVKPSLHASIFNNHLFQPSSDFAFAKWEANGLCTQKDLYKADSFVSFQSLHFKFNIPNSHLFRYLQICHFIQKQFPHYPNLDQFVNLHWQHKHLTSLIYTKNNSLSPDPTNIYKVRWEQDLTFKITDNKWTEI